jgi:polyhydroxybutyrate depolymerase
VKKILLVCSFFFIFQSVLAAQQDIEDTLMIFGRDRFFKVHLPLGYDNQKDYPLVFVFHGGLGNADNIEKMTGFSTVADTNEFIVVYPYGTGAFDKKLLTWNTWDCCGYAHKKNIDDISFIRKVLEFIKSKYKINDRMIYAAGMSNGGMMCYLVACEMSDVFAAVAPVAATMFPDGTCNPTNELSMIIFNSIDDQNIQYEGGVGEKSLVKVEKMPVQKVVDFWSNKSKCRFLNQIDETDYQIIDLANSNGTEIILYKMLKGGHTWPGGEKIRFLADTPVKAISATDLIWKFFKSHPKH